MPPLGRADDVRRGRRVPCQCTTKPPGVKPIRTVPVSGARTLTSADFPS